LPDLSSDPARTDTAPLITQPDGSGHATPGPEDRVDRDLSPADASVQSLFRVGLSLRAAADLPSELARERITDALRELDDTIRDIRDYAFASPSPGTSPDRGSPNGAT
jgi:hypothetical protein